MDIVSDSNSLKCTALKRVNNEKNFSRCFKTIANELFPVFVMLNTSGFFEICIA